MNSSVSHLEPGTWKTLHEVVHEPGFSDHAMRVIQRVPAALDDGEVLDVLHHAKGVFGADVAVFVSFIRDDESRESFRFIVAADPRWCLTYQAKSWFSNDAWLLYAAANSQPTCDTHIPLRTKGQREAREVAAEHGAISAYIVPAPAGGGLSRLGVLVLGSRIPGYFDSPAAGAIKILARSLSMELHEWWVRQIRQEVIARNRLTDDDLQLLRFEREGKSTKEIADLLSVSGVSIDSKFQRLNAKFSTPNRKAAARLAAEYGLI